MAASDYHDQWGCPSNDPCAACRRGTEASITTATDASAIAAATVAVPSWITLLSRLRQQESGVYWDRQLPKVFLLSCTSTAAGGGSSSSDHCVDKNDRAAATGRGRGKKSEASAARAWPERLAVRERLRFVALTGPSLAADSRPLQGRIADRVRALYLALLRERPDGADDEDGGGSGNRAAAVRIRALAASELRPMEASRLVVEGYVAADRPPVGLACIANLLDYGTRQAWRHGATKEGLHVLRGTVCDAAATMEWLAAVAAADHTTTARTGLALPRALGLGDRRLPYTRRVVVSQHGKRLVEDVVVVVNDGDDDDNTTNGDRAVVVVPRPPPPPPLPDRRGDARPTAPPTPERIRAEARSSPFGFLPFYYR